jgi:hypothetical protein
LSYENELRLLFEDIKSQGWIPTHRDGDQMLGNAFEDLIGLLENNYPQADWNGIELKVHRNETNSMVSLFSKSPTFPKKANSELRIKYGISDNEFGLPKLFTTISCQNFNTHRKGFGYKLETDRSNKRLQLLIKNLSSGKIVDEEIFWDFEALKKQVEKKINKLALIFGDNQTQNGVKYVRYTKMELYSNITFEKILNGIENDDITLDIRLGVYSSGTKRGKNHDHGSGFRIKHQKLSMYGDLTTF